MPAREPVARILFDESHGQAWTIRPEIAAQMQPSHPADSSFADAAAVLRAHDLQTVPHLPGDGPLDERALSTADVLVIAHPSEDRWERTVPGGSPCFTAAEIDAVASHVQSGGGLVVLGETEQDKYGTNLNELLARFGLGVAHDTVSDYTQHRKGNPHWIVADLPRTARGHDVDVLARVEGLCFYRAGTLDLDAAPAGTRVLATASQTASSPGAPLAAVTHHGAGRVAVLSDSDLFGDDCLGALGHRDLWLNLVVWAAGPRLARPLAEAPSALAADPAWPRLRDATDALRLLQQPDGTLAADAGRNQADGLVQTMLDAVAALAVHVPHQQDHLDAVRADLDAWRTGGFATPDFTASLECFRPDRHRVDGIEHLVLFPMYKQNGSRDKVFEALIVRVPWPAWLADLERTRYDNAKFVPVTLVGNTAGYDSDCAVLFPETVTVSGAPANHFGGIFCDRESARFREQVGAAARVLGVNLPPDAEALLTSESLSRDAFVLWDLVHDRAHSHGDLPFDPFMIRQRAPFWMYALEELRCDLTAFTEAVALEREGFAFARHVQTAILFDRLFRFPVTGPRVRNYDGLGGQLLFAFLHKTGRIHWTDNQLTIDWDRVADGVLELRTKVEELYRDSIDRSRLAHWAAAHDLVAAYVPSASGSRWAGAVRGYPEVEDLRPFIDEVLEDEFPLSMFYLALQRRLAALEADAGRVPVPA
ncbi:hypothetical protein DSM112329_01022 [Paraconexibacter sp. AEG42_29]|uniref:IFT52 GIFT domain-containing protein n=1 Tax=Paraconexibacter sp. AEG42_29 TaxID=2997339 RepID=A0AAU7ARA2_9ACTN